MLPSSLIETLRDALSATPTSARPVSGGCINKSAEFEAGGTRYFVKWNAAAPKGMFKAEAAGLRLLRDAEAIRVPEVLHFGEPDGCRPGFLLLTHFGSGPLSSRFDEALGAGVATLHRATGSRFGLECDNFIATLAQPNSESDNWAEFFARNRLRAQQDVAKERKSLDPSTHRLLDRIRAKIECLLPARPAVSRLHGDLWSGNFGVGHDGLPVLFDPAVYFGDREAELAFTELFGGFGPRFYASYDATWRREPGYQERRDLYNLYPLLVHANLFGGSYPRQVHDIARRFS